MPPAIRIPPQALGQGLVLQQSAAEHAEALFALTAANRDFLQQWLPWLDEVQTLDDTRTFIDTQRWLAETGEAFHFSIFLHRQLVGVLGCFDIDPLERSGQLGYWLAEPHNGQGIMQRSVAATLALGRSRLGLERFEIRCATGNHRSRAIPERLGFQLQGRIIDAEWLYDHPVDHEVYVWPGRD